MVFPGSLSSGCNRCRKRKIKCDGRRPACRRCELYRTTCPGYERPLVVRFHAGLRGGVSRDPVVGASSQPHHLIRRLSLLVNSNPTRQPQPSFEEESIMYFMHEHCVQPGPDAVRGHLDFLQDMYQASNHDSCLRQATLATAYMSLSRHYKSSTLYLTARLHYGAALRAINRDLSASPKALKDEMLASIMILGMMEDIDCEGPKAKTIHMRGISKLYDVIGHRLLSNIGESSLNSWIFSELQVLSFTGHNDLDCLAIPNANLNTSNATVRTGIVVTRINQFSRLAKHITVPEEVGGRDHQRDQLLSAMRQAIDIQLEAAQVAGSLLSPWRPQETTGKRHANAESSPLFNYTSRWAACVDSLFDVALILFFSRFLSCCRALLQLDSSIGQSAPETRLAETWMPLAEAQLRRLAQVLCATMPYMMGEVDEQGTPLTEPQQKAVVMYHLVWPLAIVIANPQSTSQQVEDCQARLNWIRDRHGIKLASAAPDLAKDMMA
ncbi:hypothetical protein BKA56DRAFT_578506 [Ilyonectria sp. MPI-CAGE-AT-0026]|nr:hypothetical protein BKA56DRAFT_578506 [Ilyonectria sp. MPI-CAGE-AT-0026]